MQDIKVSGRCDLAVVRNVRPSSLPGQLTPLLGRTQEIQALCTSLRRPEVRLVTLTGPGGVGKTRLGLQAAEKLSVDFADGVYFIPLAPVRNADLVVNTISRMLDLNETGMYSPFIMLKGALQEKQVLLVLDNFEQVLSAAPILSDLLAACPYLKILVTSRAVLHIRGEYEIPVPPLALPDLVHLPDDKALSQYASMALFLQRTRAVKANFSLTPAYMRVIAEICVYLEGLPLAIELAAARSKILSPPALLKRLEHRLAILTSGGRDVPERQQTLRNTLKWSYDLLAGEEQRLFRCLSVFAGGCTLETIESIYGTLYGQPLPVLDAVTSLVDQSLLQLREQEDEDSRIMMMETIREYGLEVLAADGEMENVRQAHALYYLELAEQAELELAGPQQGKWSERLEREYNNLQAALQWLLDRSEEKKARPGDEDMQEVALRLVGALSWFWWVRGHLSEGRTFLERALALSKDVAMSSIGAKALFSAANMAFVQSDYERAVALAAGSLALYRELGDKRGIALALDPLGNVAWLRGDMAKARAMKEEALSLYRELNDRGHVALSLFSLGLLESSKGEYAQARMLFEESLSIDRRLQNKRGIAHTLSQLAQLLFVMQSDPQTIQPLIEESQTLSQEISFKEGIAAAACISAQLSLMRGDLDAARSLAEKGAALYQAIGHRHGTAKSLSVLGKVVATEGNYAEAQALFEQCLAIASHLGETWVVAVYLVELGEVVAEQQQFVWAAQLWGASEAIRDSTGIPVPAVALADYERSISSTRVLLGEKRFLAAWAQGRAMTPEQVLATKGQKPFPVSTAMIPAAPTHSHGLTVREVEVLRLLASGLTDLKIAEKLILSPRTVHTHVSSIYTKLDLTSRSAATRYAVEHHLV